MLEGNIGAGKSTLAAALAAREPGIRAVCESIGSRFLAAFYEQPARYGFALQMTQHAARLGALRLALAATTTTTTTTILDRSILGDYAFALWNAACGHLTPLEWRLYQEQAGATIAAALAQCITAPSMVRIVFLSDAVSACFERQAARDGGAGIDRAYMTGLDAAHLVVLAAVPSMYSLRELVWGEYRAAPSLADVLVERGGGGGVGAAAPMLIVRARAAIGALVCARAVREFMTTFLDTSLAALPRRR